MKNKLFLAGLVLFGSLSASAGQVSMTCTQNQITTDSFTAKFTEVETAAGARYYLENLKASQNDPNRIVELFKHGPDARGAITFASADFNARAKLQSDAPRALIQFTGNMIGSKYIVYIHMKKYTFAPNGGRCIQD